jgi:hypothetical protein
MTCRKSGTAVDLQKHLPFWLRRPTTERCPFKIRARDAGGDHIEEELAAVGNQVVASRCFNVCVPYAKRRLALRHGGPLSVGLLPPSRLAWL